MKIFNHTTTKLSKADALRALFGKAIHITTEIEASGATEVLGTTSTTYVDKLFPRKQPAAQACPVPPACDRCQSTAYCARIPGYYCDQCATAEEQPECSIARATQAQTGQARPRVFLNMSLKVTSSK
jgi:hypothetical protein